MNNNIKFIQVSVIAEKLDNSSNNIGREVYFFSFFGYRKNKTKEKIEVGLLLFIVLVKLIQGGLPKIFQTPHVLCSIITLFFKSQIRREV